MGYIFMTYRVVSLSLWLAKRLARNLSTVLIVLKTGGFLSALTISRAALPVVWTLFATFRRDLLGTSCRSFGTPFRRCPYKPLVLCKMCTRKHSIFGYILGRTVVWKYTRLWFSGFLLKSDRYTFNALLPYVWCTNERSIICLFETCRYFGSPSSLDIYQPLVLWFRVRKRAIPPRRDQFGRNYIL